MTWRRLVRRFAGAKSNIAWLTVLLFVVAATVLAPLLPLDHPDDGSLMDSLLGPSRRHLLGTDSVGRDLLARTVFGGRVALVAALQAIVIAALIGIPIGMVIGYIGGWVDRIVMRVVEAIVSLPFLVIVIALISVTGPGLVKSMSIVGLIYSTWLLRLARGQVLAAREELYTDASRVAGNSPRRILMRQILPNIAPPLIVQITLLFAAAIVAESTLSFLGLGVQAPTASWGSMLADAQGLARTGLWPAVPPGVAIVVTVLALNQVGDGLRDSFSRDSAGGGFLSGRRTERSSIPANTPVTSPWSSPGSSPAMVSTPGEPLLVIDGLTVRFPNGKGERHHEVVSDFSLAVQRGEIVGLVGESGSGKSITALSVLGLVPAPGQVSARSILFDGRDLVGLDYRGMRSIRGREIGVVFQEPHAHLNPAFTVGDQLCEVLRTHLSMSRRQARERAIELLHDVGITRPAERFKAYPHQFSGGMAQRVVIALAVAAEPKLLIADEPTTALDVSVQRQILDLLVELRDSRGLSILLISHDLGVIADVADQVAVMYAGQLVEQSHARSLFESPLHPYADALLKAMPRNERRTGRLPSIRGSVPAATDFPPHCRFAARCDLVAGDCTDGPVELRFVGDRTVRCLHPLAAMCRAPSDALAEAVVRGDRA